MKNNKKPCRLILSKEQKIALLDGFQKQNTHTTLKKYAKANNVNVRILQSWAVLYEMPLGMHYTNVIKKKPTHDDPLLEALRNQYPISQ